MTVVLDCNVIVSAARIDGTCRAVVDNVVRNHDIVLSDPILAEYESVAARPKHAAYRDDLKAMIGDIERVAVIVEPADIAFGLRDPDDEIYLATAMAGSALLITGNTRTSPSRDTRRSRCSLHAPSSIGPRERLRRGLTPLPARLCPLRSYRCAHSAL